MKRLKTHQKRERHWRRLIEEWKQSQQSIEAFCRSQQLSVSSFYLWRKKLAQLSAPPLNEVPSFVPVRLAEESPKALKLYLPNGCWVTLESHFDKPLLKKLLTCVEVSNVDVTGG